jgi:tRNA-modifying protein YgfZ
MSAPRAGIAVSGPDAQSYLHSQLSQDITAVDVGETRWSFVLEPTGKVTALVRLARTGPERFVLDVEADTLDALVARLSRFKIRVKADIEVLDDPVAPLFASERERIDAGWPQMGAEIVSGETIPAETGVVADAVSFTKGCYPGQELVERMDSRGASAPRLVRRLVATEGSIPLGAIVTVDRREVGHVTSTAGGVALASVHRSIEPGTTVMVDDVPATVHATR